VIVRYSGSMAKPVKMVPAVERAMALIARAREVVATSRNRRHVAVLRRALVNKVVPKT